jgi:hypothetical protein
VKALDDKLGATAQAVVTAPATYKSGTLAALANAYDDAGEPDRAAAMRRLALQEPLLLPFAQLSASKQRAAIDALPEEAQPAAKTIQRQQAEAFARDAFTTGTALYPDIGQPADDIEGRITQARTIAERRSIPVAPLTTGEIATMRRQLAEGSPEERDILRVRYAALPDVERGR